MHHNMHLISTRVDSLLLVDQSLTLQEIAHSIGIDRHKIEAAIQERYSFSFRELKKQVRLKRAVALLEKQPRCYIKEISAVLGVTPNYLSRFIKSMTGHCATELRCQKCQK